MSARMPHPLVLRWIGPLLRGRRAGDRLLAGNHPMLARVPDTLALRSDGFGDGEPMGRRSAGLGVGENRSPALAWSGMPDAARYWLLLVEDPDVPLPAPIVHAVAWGPSTVRALPDGALGDGDGNAVPGVTCWTNGLGMARYDGPRPLPGHGPHRYVFQLFALTEPPPGPMRADALVAWLATHAVAAGRLTGICQRDWWSGSLVAA